MGKFIDQGKDSLAYLPRFMLLAALVFTPVTPIFASKIFSLDPYDASQKNSGAGFVLWMSLQK